MLDAPEDSKRLKDLIKKSPDIFSQLYVFNYLPASYIHPAQRSEFFENQLPEKVWTQPRVWPALSLRILQQLNLENHPFVEFPQKDWCCILLPTSRLMHCARHIGAIVVSSLIRSSLARDEVLEWKNKLGHELFNFVMNRGALFKAKGTNSAVNGMDDIEKIGCRVILASIGSLPEHVLQRVQLKMQCNVQMAHMEKKLAENLVQSVLLLLERKWYFSLEAASKKSESIVHQKF